MKKIAFSGILVLACVLGTQFGFAGTAQAQTNNWTGLYIGANIGVANNRDGGNATCVTPGGVVDGTGCETPTFGNIRANGGLAGGQIGYNWQFNRFVVAPEISFDTSTLTGSTTFGGPIPIVGGGSDSGTFNASETIGWLATARLRLGVTLGQKMLAYVTGGYARMNGSVLSNFVFNSSSPVYMANPNVQENGFIGGVGAEWQVQPKTSFRFELSEFHFPDYTTDVPSTPFATGYIAGKHFHFRGYTLTGGVNFRL